MRVHLAFGTVVAMDNVARAADMLKRVGRMVEGFLDDLMQTAPNDLDCLALERSAMTVVLDLGPLSRSAFALIFCFATEHSAANSSEIRANVSVLALSHRVFIFPYRLVSLTIWNVKNFTGCV